MMYYLHELRDHFGALRVLESITFRAAMACLTAFAASIWLGPQVIRMLLALKMGQPIRSAEVVHRLHDLHAGKAGTPTMGGVLIIGTVAFSTLLWGRVELPFVHTCLLVMIGAGGIGFADDYIKVRQRSSDGLSARMKLVLQTLLACVAGAYLIMHPDTAEFMRKLHVPFFKEPIVLDMGWFALPFFALVMVSCSNAVNLTDGLDGLATGCAVSTLGTYGFLAYAAGTVTVADYLLIPHHGQIGELSVFCAALVGAGFGFLWFNCHPALVFMGDTGSLALGAAIGAVSICTRHELLLMLIGGVFVMESLSVILQVGSFKLRGKRIFLMSPIHHHFELKGWHENQVILRFWMISILMALLGLATLKLR